MDPIFSKIVHKGAITDIKILSSDDESLLKLVTVSVDQSMIIWSEKDGNFTTDIIKTPHNMGIVTVITDRSRNIAYTMALDGEGIIEWNIKTKTIIRRHAQSGFDGWKLVIDGSNFIYSNLNGVLTIIPLDNNNTAHQKKYNICNFITDMFLSPVNNGAEPNEKQLIVTCSDGHIHLLSVGTGITKLKVINVTNQPLRCLATSEDSSVIIVGGEDGMVWIYRDLVRYKIIPINNSWVTSLAISPDNSTVAIGTIDGRLQIYEIAAIEIEEIFMTNLVKSPSAIRYTSDGKRLVVGDMSGTLSIWDLNNDVYNTYRSTTHY